MTSVFDIARNRKKNLEEENDIQQEETIPEESRTQKPPEKSALFKKVEEKKEHQNKQEKIQKLKKKEQELPLEGENDLDRDIERNVARGLSRGLETVGGIPGDISAFVRSFIPGTEGGRIFPTSSELQKGAEQLGQGYLTPQNETEKTTDDLVKDVASFMIPGSGQASFVRNIGLPIAGLAAKEGIKKLGGGEGKQTYGKIGTMFFLDVLNARRTMGMGGARNFLNFVRDQSERMIPAGTTIRMNGLGQALQHAIRSLEMGGPAPSKNAALESMRHLLGQVNNDQIAVRELIQARKALNEQILSKGGFSFFQQPQPIQDAAVRNLNQVKGLVINGLERYGQTNPQFGAWNSAFNEGYSAYAASNYFTNFIKKHFGDKVTNATVKALTGLGPVAGAVGMKFAPVYTGLAAASIPVYQAIKLGHRIAQSPTLRNYYGNLVRHAFQGNVAAANTNIKGLEKTFEKEEKEKEAKIKDLKKKVSHQKRKVNKSS
jgi:hypothetical protein